MNTTTTLSPQPDSFNQVPTMTSLEMADLAEKRHDSVKRTIDMLAERGAISQPQIVDGKKAANGVIEQVYLVGKRDSYVVMAQLSPEFTARLVDRWQELEAKQAAPVALSTMDILTLAMESEKGRLEAVAQLAIAAPAITHLQAVQSSKDDFTFQEMALILQEHGYSLGRNRLMNVLRRAGVLTKGSNLPMQYYREHGYFRVVQSIRESSSGRPHIDLTAYVTGKGHNWLIKVFDKILLKVQKMGVAT